MGSKRFLNTFIIVLTSTLVFYGFSSVGALAISNAHQRILGIKPLSDLSISQDKKNKQ